MIATKFYPQRCVNSKFQRLWYDRRGLRAGADLQNFKILSPASACLRGDRDKIYTPRFKKASSRDEILRLIFKKSRARAPAKVVNLARNFIPPHSLSVYQICLPSGRGEISHCPSMRARSKISRSRFSNPYSNKRSTYRAGPSRNTRLWQPVLEAGMIKFRVAVFQPRAIKFQQLAAEILYYRSLAGSVRASI